MTFEQHSSRRLLAGLLTGALVATLGPIMGAVAGQSGNAPTSEIRRGAEVWWQQPTEDYEGYVDYRFWVWQAAYAPKAGTVPQEAPGLKGEAVAARRICVSWDACGRFTYWRAPLGETSAVGADGDVFVMDVATGIAHFQGVLTRSNGERCTVTMDWSNADPQNTYGQPPRPGSPNGEAWRPGGRAQGTMSCWPQLAPSTWTKVWINTGL